MPLFGATLQLDAEHIIEKRVRSIIQVAELNETSKRIYITKLCIFKIECILMDLKIMLGKFCCVL